MWRQEGNQVWVKLRKPMSKLPRATLPRTTDTTDTTGTTVRQLSNAIVVKEWHHKWLKRSILCFYMEFLGAKPLLRLILSIHLYVRNKMKRSVCFLPISGINFYLLNFTRCELLRQGVFSKTLDDQPFVL